MYISMPLIEDNTRDNFSSTEDRKKSEYKILDIFKVDTAEGISYMAKDDKGEERFLLFQGNAIDDKLDIICNNTKFQHLQIHMTTQKIVKIIEIL